MTDSKPQSKMIEIGSQMGSAYTKEDDKKGFKRFRLNGKVVVDGKILMQNGQIETINEQEIMKELMNRIDEIVAKISATETKGKELQPYLRKAYMRCLYG